MDTLPFKNNIQQSQNNSGNYIFISRKKILVAVLIIVLILLGESSYLLFLAHKSPFSLTGHPLLLGHQSILSQLKSDQQQYTAVMNQAKSAQNKQSYISAAASLTTYAAQTQNTDNRYNALFQAASLYASAGNYKDALAAFKQTEQIKGITYSECNGAGLMAKYLGEKQEAISYFQKCLTLMPANFPWRTSQIQWYKNQIALLNK